MKDWQEGGLTPVVVARQQDNDRIMFGVYLVDYYCLGVKNAYTRTDYSLNHFERELPKLCAQSPSPCSAELAHELVYEALAYAHNLGFEPHPDFHKLKADLMLDPPETHPRRHTITFGKDGKPLYISGPNDSMAKSQMIVNTLLRTCGPGNFDHLITLNDPQDSVPPDPADA